MLANPSSNSGWRLSQQPAPQSVLSRNSLSCRRSERPIPFAYRTSSTPFGHEETFPGGRAGYFWQIVRTERKFARGHCQAKPAAIRSICFCSPPDIFCRRGRPMGIARATIIKKLRHISRRKAVRSMIRNACRRRIPFLPIRNRLVGVLLPGRYGRSPVLVDPQPRLKGVRAVPGGGTAPGLPAGPKRGA